MRTRLALNEHWLLAMLLLLLHAVIWGELGTALSRSLMLAHLGLFLIWQPVWRGDQPLDRVGALAFVAGTVAFVVWLNWLLVFVWLLLLIGLIGGRVFIDRGERFAYLLILVALVSELLMGVVTHMFSVPIGRVFTLAFDYGLLLPPLILVFVPASRGAPAGQRPVDLLHGLTFSLLTGVLAMGALLVMYRGHTQYVLALFQTLIALAVFLLVISWLLSPHAGFSGLRQHWSRYLLNVGTPFGEWLEGLSNIAREHASPEGFLEAAMAQVVDLPWVTGVAWRSPSGSDQVGAESAHASIFSSEGLEVIMYADRNPGATLTLHGRLLIQVIAYFHTAKRAQQELARHAHLQAIFETGARVTHDIKNLLQSLHTMSMVLEEGSRSDDQEVLGLLRRQLPHLTQRLRLALDKLQFPAPRPPAAEDSLAGWWEAFMARHQADGIRFDTRIGGDPRVPVECFESVVENLLENARVKRQADPDLEIGVSLIEEGGRLELRVCDSGSPVPERVAAALFKEAVESAQGLGIGLYQAARQAASVGYTLSLWENQPGSVCFALSGAVKASPEAATSGAAIEGG